MCRRPIHWNDNEKADKAETDESLRPLYPFQFGQYCHIIQMMKNFDHVALAVENDEEAVALFEELLGLKFTENWTVPRDSMAVSCAHIGSAALHVISSLTPDGLIAKYVRDRGEGIHHIAVSVKDIDAIAADLKKKGVKLVPDNPITREPSGPRYIFVHPKSAHGVMIELKQDMIV